MITRAILVVLFLRLLCAPAHGLVVPATTLGIPSTTPWTDTGIDVAAGELVIITANGTVTVSTGGPPIDANGAGCCSPDDPLPQTIHLSLIGMIVDNRGPGAGTPLSEGTTGKGPGFIGTAYQMPALATGRLYLGFNDDYYSDNSGSFTVTVTVLPPPDLTNHTYQLVTGTFTWHQAKADAEARGGYLATITSQAELNYVIAKGVLTTSDSYWLGATDEQQEGVWKWVTGEAWDFSNWQQGEPNNQGPENYLVAGNSIEHRWNDWGREDNTQSFYLLEIGGTTCTPHKATATAQLVNGFVVGATVTKGGCGYTNAPLVLIQGGGGTGAMATATITDGRVTGIQIISAGCCYTNTPRIVIASPPFVPSLRIEVSKVRVIQDVVLGRKYVLEASTNGNLWNIAAPAFTAEDESVTNEFDTDLTGRFFRVREVP